jgi:glycerate 2-kinase
MSPKPGPRPWSERDGIPALLRTRSVTKTAAADNMPDLKPDLKKVARAIFRETLAGIDIFEAMRSKVSLKGSHLSITGIEPGASGIAVDLAAYGRVRLVALGKASIEMARGLVSVLEPAVTVEGIVVAPTIATPADANEHDEILAARDSAALPRVTPARTGAGPSSLRLIRAGHPEPDEESFRAAREILELLHLCGAGTLVFFLLSGGGSSLVELPLDAAITLGEMQQLNRVLVTCGASIAEINTVRKHLSAVKGGRLAAAAPTAMKVTLGVSDVPAGCESALASGPTLPDPSTIYDACRVIERYALLPRLPAPIRTKFDPAKFDHPATIPETPKEGDAIFALSRFALLLGMGDLFRCAQRAAEGHGCITVCDNTTDDWPVARAADYLLGELARIAVENPGHRVALIADGELSSPVTGGGIGGRNSAFVLACVEKIAEMLKTPSLQKMLVRKIAVLSAGTDGRDGSSPAAGAVADEETLARARSRNLDPAEFMLRSDSYSFFRALGDDIETGPTGNNLRDLRVLLAE